MESRKTLLKGTKNALLPSVQVFADFTNNGLAGPSNPLYSNCCGAAQSLFHRRDGHRDRADLPPQLP